MVIEISGKHEKEHGVALILVLWVMVILTAIISEFAYSMRTELNITRNFKEEEEAYQLALAGVEHAKIEILSAKEPVYPFFNKNGILVFGEGEEKGDEGEKDPVREGRFKNGAFSYTIIDEDGKLNINIASLEQLRYIIRNSGVDTMDVDSIVDSIVDWKDTDNLHMLNGAEEDYYQSLQKPYSCKDGPFDIIEELLLIKGMTREIFFGSKEKEEEQKYDGVAQYLTPKNSNNININTATEIVLEAFFGVKIADNIIKQRETSPILNPIANGVVKSNFFTIISTGTNADGTIKRSIKTILQKKENKLETIYWNDNWIEDRTQNTEAQRQNEESSA